MPFLLRYPDRERPPAVIDFAPTSAPVRPHTAPSTSSTPPRSASRAVPRTSTAPTSTAGSP